VVRLLEIRAVVEKTRPVVVAVVRENFLQPVATSLLSLLARILSGPEHLVFIIVEMDSDLADFELLAKPISSSL